MVEVVEELPKAIVRRVVKEKLSQCSEAGDMSIHKDALLAISESARIFIHYLSATANDICKESKRQTLNADDVLKAIEEIEFPEFLGPLTATLEDFRRKNSKKRAGAAKGKEANKKRKEDVPPEITRHTEDGEVEGSDDDANDHDQHQDVDVDDEDKQDNEGNADDDELQDNAEDEVEDEDADVFEQQKAMENEEIFSGDVIEDHTERDDEDNPGNNIRSPREDADEDSNTKVDT